MRRLIYCMAVLALATTAAPTFADPDKDEAGMGAMRTDAEATMVATTKKNIGTATAKLSGNGRRTESTRRNANVKALATPGTIHRPGIRSPV